MSEPGDKVEEKRLVALIAEQIKRAGIRPTPRMRPATVTAVSLSNATPTITATIAGDSTPIPGIKVMADYWPLVGDVFWLWQDAEDVIAIQRIGTGSRWIDADPAYGWQNLYSGYETLAYCRIGEIVYLKGSIVNTIAGNNTFLYLPPGYRPASGRLVNGVSNAGENVTFHGTWIIDPTGPCFRNSGAGAASFTIQASFPATY